MGAREDLERIEAKVDWCVSALKYLLQGELGEPGDEESEDDYWGWDDPEQVALQESRRFSTDELRAQAAADEDRLNPAPPLPKNKPCPHNAQGILDGHLICLRCHIPLAASGVIQDRVGSDGRILLDPNPPIPRAGAETREASTRNPGGALVPN